MRHVLNSTGKLNTLLVDDLTRLEGRAADGENEDIVETENNPGDDEDRERGVCHELELAVKEALGNWLNNGE